MSLTKYIDNFIDEAFDPIKGKSKNTRVSYKGKLRELNEMLNEIKGKNYNVSSLTFDDLQEYADELYRKGNKPSSVANKCLTLQVFMKYLRKRGIIKSDITRDKDGEKLSLAKVKKRRAKILEEEEYLQMLQNISWKKGQKNVYDGEFITKRNIALLLLFLATGLRRNEMLHLKRSDIYNNVINIIGKGDKEREIPLNTTALAVVREWLEYYDKRLENKDGEDVVPNYNSELIFPSIRGGVISDGVYWKLVEKALNTIHRGKYVVDNDGEYVLDENGEKIDNTNGIKPHSLRKSFASKLLQNGVHIKVISELLGHASISTTELYLDVTDKDKAKAIDTLQFDLKDD